FLPGAFLTGLLVGRRARDFGGFNAWERAASSHAYLQAFGEACVVVFGLQTQECHADYDCDGPLGPAPGIE
ncbi:MAG: hypothetical protein K0V04_14450, partial [Deltaproteobacteria bacterium]|nr:hypothetical protein [Deltaproteobacteria bacterium]